MLNKIYVKDKQARSIFPKKWRAKE